jgi:hypothetical protein
MYLCVWGSPPPSLSLSYPMLVSLSLFVRLGLSVLGDGASFVSTLALFAEQYYALSS